MQDRVPLHAGRVKLTPVAGTTDKFDMEMADEPTVEGTPLNKANLLSDATAAMLGLGTDATVDDALKVGGGAEITVLTIPNAEVMATNGETTASVTANDNGIAVLYCTFGEWTISSAGRSATVTVDVIKQYTVAIAAIDDITWSQISDIAQSGQADSYYDIGDTKRITLNGTIGTKSYSNVTLYVFILMFNCPTNKTTADNNIIWGGFKTALTGGVDVGLDDANYNNIPSSGTISFNMNHTYTTSSGSAGSYGTNYGGWKGTDLRYDILGTVETSPSQYNQNKSASNVGYDATTAAITSPKSNSLMAALPSDFRSVLRLWTRWVDNVGNSSNVDANVTACVDAGISLLTEFEVHGTRARANKYEQNHQVQMTYYANGNSKIKYRQSSDDTLAFWWVASPIYNSGFNFCRVGTTVSTDETSAYWSQALAPAFKT